MLARGGPEEQVSPGVANGADIEMEIQRRIEGQPR